MKITRIELKELNDKGIIEVQTRLGACIYYDKIEVED
jgi:hypothetical protein